MSFELNVRESDSKRGGLIAECEVAGEHITMHSHMYGDNYHMVQIAGKGRYVRLNPFYLIALFEKKDEIVEHLKKVGVIKG